MIQSCSPEELHAPSPPTKKPKPPSLRIVVPPTEYCPFFNTDLTLPTTPHSLPTPVSSSCFTFTDLTPSSRPRDPTVALCASPTSSQFLLMPPTTHAEDIPVRVASAATDGAMHSESKSGNPSPWQVPSSTWLSDLGGHTETDRIFQHNLLGIAWLDTDTSSPASTPALSPSAVSPSSQVSSVLAHNLPFSPPRFPASSPCPFTMSPSPARLALKPTGTDAFPSMLDSLEAWRTSVTPGPPRSEELPSPLSVDVHGSQLEDFMIMRPPSPPRLSQSRHFSLRTPRPSRSQAFIKHAKILGGRVKQLVTRQNIHRHRGSMDRGISFSVVTSHDSQDGSVILITAPPPPYDPHGDPIEQEHATLHTTSVYSAVRTSTAELASPATTEFGSRQGGSNRNALRRFSIAAFSTLKRF